jgi:hypothetical protein
VEDELTTPEILDGLRIDAEEFFAVINDDSKLDGDAKDDLTRKFEGIIELLDDAKKIVATSYESE